MRRRGCLGVSAVDLIHWANQLCIKACGLQSTMVKLDAETTMHCWVPRGGGAGIDPRPAVVLIHGFGLDAAFTWRKQVTALYKHFAVYLPDLLFFGGSTTTSNHRTEGFQAECVKRLLDKLGVRQVTVVGYSYGGFVAFRMAHMFPGTVKLVVLLSSAICADAAAHERLFGRTGAKDMAAVLLPRKVNAGTRRTARLIVHHTLPWIPDCVYQDLLEIVTANREEKESLLKEVVIGCSDRLPVLTQSSLVVWGERDRVFPVDLAYRLQRHLGEDKCRLEIIKNAGHAPSFERPEAVNQVLLRFLRS